MLTKNSSLRYIARTGAFALLGVVAIGAAKPASAATVPAVSISQPAAMMPTDISASRRHRQARHASPRNAYGSYGGGAGPFATPSPSGYSYGYGVGDNSRGQTW